MNVCGWFEIPVSDMDRAQKFYEKVVGVSLQREESMGALCAVFPMKPDANCGSLTQGEGYTPSASGVVIYLEVDCVEKASKRAEEAGGSVVLSCTALPEAEQGYIALIMDTEGNRIGLHS